MEEITKDRVTFHPPDPVIHHPSAHIHIDGHWAGTIYKLSSERSWGFSHAASSTRGWAGYPTAQDAFDAFLYAADITLVPF